MAIKDMTNSSERHLWYDHELTKELRKEVAERAKDITQDWQDGRCLDPAQNLASVTAYQLLTNILEFMDGLKKEPKEEEVEEEEVDLNVH